MRVDAHDTIAGHPVLAVRDALRASSRTSRAVLAHHLALSDAQATALLQVLIERGLITPADSEDDLYDFTIKGNAFRMARALKPITRAKADSLVRDLLTRVHHVNTSPDFLIRVDSVQAFGSYTTASPTVNDIDLVIHRSDKEQWPDRAAEFLAHAHRSGRRFSSFIDEILWPETQVTLFLKNRSPRLSFHAPTDGILPLVQLVQIFPTPSRPTLRRR